MKSMKQQNKEVAERLMAEAKTEPTAYEDAMARKTGATVEQLRKEAAGHTCVDQPNQPCANAECGKSESKPVDGPPKVEIKSGELRKHLEWSWNYELAESFGDDTVKETARAISMGIDRGEDQDDTALLEDFWQLRTNWDQPCVIHEQWTVEDPTAKLELDELLKRYVTQEGLDSETQP